jgi:excisionase family DNA binding protein
MSKQLQPPAAKLLLKVEEVTEMLNLGRSKLYQYLLTGELRSVKVGRRRLIPPDAVHEFVQKLESTQEGAST